MIYKGTLQVPCLGFVREMGSKGERGGDWFRGCPVVVEWEQRLRSQGVGLGIYADSMHEKTHNLRESESGEGWGWGWGQVEGEGKVGCEEENNAKAK